MLKTLKWVYQLGYKHAENKLYHQLLHVVTNERPTELEMMGFDDKSKYSKEDLQQRQAVTYRLQQAIDDVFHPVVSAPEEYFEKNRFEL